MSGARRLEGKRALITGCAHGIGAATARAFAREGAAVALVDLDAAAAQALCAELNAADARAVAIAADVSNEPQLAGAVRRAVEALGGIEVAVANAGVFLTGRDAPAHELDLADWRRTLDVNLTGVFLTAKHVIGWMLDSGTAGSLICTGSPTGMLGGSGAGYTAYSTTKAGVHGLVRELAADYSGRGVRVNAVVPGFIHTRLTEEFVHDPRLRDEVLSRVPIGRHGQPDDVAPMMVFLASDEAAYATGGLYPIDGGMTSF